MLIFQLSVLNFITDAIGAKLLIKNPNQLRQIHRLDAKLLLSGLILGIFFIVIILISNYFIPSFDLKTLNKITNQLTRFWTSFDIAAGCTISLATYNTARHQIDNKKDAD